MDGGGLSSSFGLSGSFTTANARRTVVCGSWRSLHQRRRSALSSRTFRRTSATLALSGSAASAPRRSAGFPFCFRSPSRSRCVFEMDSRSFAVLRRRPKSSLTSSAGSALSLSCALWRASCASLPSSCACSRFSSRTRRVRFWMSWISGLSSFVSSPCSWPLPSALRGGGGPTPPPSSARSPTLAAMLSRVFLNMRSSSSKTLSCRSAWASPASLRSSLPLSSPRSDWRELARSGSLS
mmetsp:Transcript_14602/g.41734  ORF Transcript_14602/g.41734 Transcript_14602/m.41734 type:complete len:238 (+) Transcript_14602:167-880(+)